MKINAVLIILILSFPAPPLLAQEMQWDAPHLARQLAEKSHAIAAKIPAIQQQLEKADSSQAFQWLETLAREGKTYGFHFQARLLCLRARTIHHKNVFDELSRNRKPANAEPVKKEIDSLLTAAMDLAYRSEDDYLIAFVSFWYATTVSMYGDVGVAVMYAKNAIDKYEQLSYPVKPEFYQFLSEILYRVREYEETTRYARKAAEGYETAREPEAAYRINCLNTTALGYHRQEKYDSAFLYYNKALQLARQNNNNVWAGIVSGNMGQIYYVQGQYDTAYQLLQQDYQTSKAAGYFDNAANSLQWAARVNLAKGNKTTALVQIREVFRLLTLWPDASYRKNACQTASAIFRQTGAYDSAFYYNNLYSIIHDSLQKMVTASSLAITKARLNDETSRYTIQNINRDRKAQVLFRNILIATIIVLSIIALLLVNRQRLQQKLALEKANREKMRIEQEMRLAREQLHMFTENIIEKSNLIEKLEQEVNNRIASVEQQAIMTELSRQTILTEEDWLKFKSLFEKIYPGFFINLKNSFPDITLAEQRMAALTRLHLTTKQVASMLGISVDSVHKTRQRLRQRLLLPTEASLEETLAAI